MYSSSVRRRCRSPKISMRSVTSLRTVSTNLSAYAFALGLRGGILHKVMPASASTGCDAEDVRVAAGDLQYEAHVPALQREGAVDVEESRRPASWTPAWQGTAARWCGRGAPVP